MWRDSVQRGGLLAGAAHPRRQKHREMPPPGASAPAFAAAVEPACAQVAAGGRIFVAAPTTAGGLFSFAATKNRIGRGPRCRHGRCRRNHSRKMPFRSKFCYISNSSYICIAVPGVPLSDVSADDESGFFLFTNLIHFSDYAAFVACCPCLYPYDYAAGGLFFDAATTVCRRNYSSVPVTTLAAILRFTP